MSVGGLSMSQIVSWRPETLIAGADEAKAHNTRLLGILDGIKDATSRMAAESSGPGETARFDFIGRATKFGYDKHELMAQHQQLVEEAGYDLKAKADRVLTEVQAARKAGLIVWDDGNVSGEIPRQREDLERYTASIGEAKHALEQADKEHARKIREHNKKIKEGTEGGYREADYFEKFGNLKDEPPPGSKEPVIHDNDPTGRAANKPTSGSISLHTSREHSRTKRRGRCMSVAKWRWTTSSGSKDRKGCPRSRSRGTPSSAATRYGPGAGS